MGIQSAIWVFWSAGLVTSPGKIRRVSSVAGVEQSELPDPSMLADPDSCFYKFKGLKIHYKVCKAGQDVVDLPLKITKLDSHSKLVKRKSCNTTTPFPIILFHGFAASVLSWERIRQPLAKMLGTTVLAFDRPAFGLTSRPSLLDYTSCFKGEANCKKGINPYSTAFSVEAASSFIDLLQSEKSILIGHSAGCATAIDTYFEAPDRVAALILVAPAILAPKQRKRPSTSEKKTELDEFSAQGLVDKMADMVSILWDKSLRAFLRSTLALILIRVIVDKIGVAAIRASCNNAKDQATDYVLKGYTKPLQAKGWDMALLEYVRATFTSSSPDCKPPSSRLHEITCPVLVVTGDKDRLVPVRNSRRVSEAIPGSTFEVMKECGHLPHEERAEEFLSIVTRFIKIATLASPKDH